STWNFIPSATVTSRRRRRASSSGSCTRSIPSGSFSPSDSYTSFALERESSEMLKQPKGRPVVIGVADHSGWAVLVSVAAVNGKPAVVDRPRGEMRERGVPSQPYHHETLSLSDTDAERMLRQVRRSIAACTTTAFDRLAADLSPPDKVSDLH